MNKYSIARGRFYPLGYVLTFAALILATSLAGAAEKEPRQALEIRVKANFLYTFGKYVEWPTETLGASTNAFVIGIVGKDPFGETLDATVTGKNIDGHPVRIQRFQRIEDVPGCHVLFISASEKERLAELLKRLRGHPILTVSDMDHFLESGGQVQFVSENNRMMFDIDLNPANKAGLKLNSNLLRVARRVIPQPGKVESE